MTDTAEHTVRPLAITFEHELRFDSGLAKLAWKALEGCIRGWFDNYAQINGHVPATLPPWSHKDTWPLSDPGLWFNELDYSQDMDSGTLAALDAVAVAMGFEADDLGRSEALCAMDDALAGWMGHHFDGHEGEWAQLQWDAWRSEWSNERPQRSRPLGSTQHSPA